MKVTIIAVAGASGSGKTTIANALYAHYGAAQCTIISSDNYYKGLGTIPLERRHEVNFDHPDSIDFELLADHLMQLKAEKSVEIPTYDFSISSRKEETIPVSPTPIIIVEGILILHPRYLTELFDIKIFVQTQSDLCFIRRLERDIKERGRTTEDVIAQYKKDVKPMYELYVKPCKKYADFVIENNEEISAMADMKPVLDVMSRTMLEEKAGGQQRFKLFSRATHEVTPVASPLAELSKRQETASPGGTF